MREHAGQWETHLTAADHGYIHGRSRRNHSSVSFKPVSRSTVGSKPKAERARSILGVRKWIGECFIDTLCTLPRPKRAIIFSASSAVLTRAVGLPILKDFPKAASFASIK